MFGREQEIVLEPEGGGTPQGHGGASRDPAVLQKAAKHRQKAAQMKARIARLQTKIERLKRLIQVLEERARRHEETAFKIDPGFR